MSVYDVTGGAFRAAASISSDESGATVWTDLNANGVNDGGGEVVFYGSGAWLAMDWSDKDGSIFYTDTGRNILKLTVTGFAGNSPVYNLDTGRTPLVAAGTSPWGFGVQGNDPIHLSTDYVTGEIHVLSTTALNRDMSIWGGTGGTALARYAADGTRISVLPIDHVPQNGQADVVGAYAADNGYIYAGYSGWAKGQGVKMYTDDMLQVASGEPIVGGGWIDVTHAMAAITVNGRRHVYVEDDAHSRYIRYVVNGAGSIQKSVGNTFAFAPRQVVSLSTADGDAAELGGDAASFTITRDSSSGSLTVLYVVAGTATDTADYVHLGGSVTFGDGETSKTIAIDPVNDGLAEGAGERLAVAILDNDSYRISNNNHAFDGFEAAGTAGWTGGWHGWGSIDFTSEGAPYAGGGHMRLRGQGYPGGRSEMQRNVNLTGDSPTVLSFYWKADSLEPGDGAFVHIMDASGTWRTVLTVNDSMDDNAYHAFSMDLSNFALDSGFSVYVMLAAYDTDDYFYVDNIVVSEAGAFISDNDVPVVTIAATDGAGEPNDDGTFTVATNGNVVPTVVNYTISGTAANGTDYVSLPGSVTIPAGQTSATITVDVLDDALVEASESVILTVTPSASGPIAFSNNSFEDPVGGAPWGGGPTPTDWAGDGYAVNLPGYGGAYGIPLNGPDGSDQAVFLNNAWQIHRDGLTAMTPGAWYTFTIHASADYTGSQAIDLKLYRGSYGAETTLATTSVHISIPGTWVPITVRYFAQAEDVGLPLGVLLQGMGGGDAFVVDLASLSTGGIYTVGAPGSATMYIDDDDNSVTIAATDDLAAEPNDDGAFTVTRTGTTAAALVVNYTIAGTATNGIDYTILSGAVTIPAGQTSAPILVDVLDDPLIEGSETVTLTLAAANAPIEVSNVGFEDPDTAQTAWSFHGDLPTDWVVGPDTYPINFAGSGWGIPGQGPDGSPQGLFMQWTTATHRDSVTTMVAGTTYTFSVYASADYTADDSVRVLLYKGAYDTDPPSGTLAYADYALTQPDTWVLATVSYTATAQDDGQPLGLFIRSGGTESIVVDAVSLTSGTGGHYLIGNPNYATVTINEVNVPPVLAPIGDKSVDEQMTLSFTATASDSDVPANTLTFGLDAASIALGMTIHPTTGVFGWTPTEAHGPATYPVTVSVNDNSGLTDSRQFNVAVLAGPDTTPPFVSSFKTTKKGNSLATMVVGFSEAMTPEGVLSLSSYRLISAGRDRRFGTKDDKTLALGTVKYDTSKRLATITTKRSVALNQPLRLIIRGSALTDLAGNKLDGDGDKEPGGDCVKSFGTKPRR